MCTCTLDPFKPNPAFHEVIDSRPGLLGEVTERIMRFVRTVPCGEESLEQLSLALHEALTNAIVHGNGEDPSKKVEICGAWESAMQFVLAITDEGEGFDPDALPDPTVAENIFSAHGRGVFLIKRLVDRAEFRLGGRQVVLHKQLGSQTLVSQSCSGGQSRDVAAERSAPGGRAFCSATRL